MKGAVILAIPIFPAVGDFSSIAVCFHWWRRR